MENMAMCWLITIAVATAALLVFGAAWVASPKTARQVTGSG